MRQFEAADIHSNWRVHHFSNIFNLQILLIVKLRVLNITVLNKVLKQKGNRQIAEKQNL